MQVPSKRTNPSNLLTTTTASSHVTQSKPKKRRTDQQTDSTPPPKVTYSILIKKAQSQNLTPEEFEAALFKCNPEKIAKSVWSSFSRRYHEEIILPSTNLIVDLDQSAQNIIDNIEQTVLLHTFQIQSEIAFDQFQKDFDFFQSRLNPHFLPYLNITKQHHFLQITKIKTIIKDLNSTTHSNSNYKRMLFNLGDHIYSFILSINLSLQTLNSLYKITPTELSNYITTHQKENQELTYIDIQTILNYIK